MNDAITSGNIRTQTLVPEPEPFQLVGKWKPQGIYSKNKHDKHVIYDRLISLLEGRQAVDQTTGEVVPCIVTPLLRERLREAGRTELEIEQYESSIIDVAEMHPRWSVQQYVPPALYHTLKREGREELIAEQRIVAAPNSLLNALVCEKLLTMFTRRELLATDGFIPNGEGVKLDIESRYARRGFIIPIFLNKKIDCLKVYRNPTDRDPFFLRSRRRANV